MLVAAVAVQLGAERGLGVGDVTTVGRGDAGSARPGQGDGHLEAGERVAPVAAGPLGEVGERLGVGVGALGVEPLPSSAATAVGRRAAGAGTASSGTAAAG